MIGIFSGTDMIKIWNWFKAIGSFVRKIKEKHKCRFVFLRCRFVLINHRQNDQCDQRQAVLHIVNHAVSEMYNS